MPDFLLGVSEAGGWQVQAAAGEIDAGRAQGVMLSANALRPRGNDYNRPFRDPPLVFPAEPWEQELSAARKLSHPGHSLPDVLNTALDSAGFVAMKRYGGFPWKLTDYLDLAVSHPWIWYSQPDLCCEQEIASDRQEVGERVGRSAGLLGRCLHQLDVWGREVGALPDPMPVLQGWRPDDYLLSLELTARMLDLHARPFPALVGLGSVCRRQPKGEDGLVAVLTRLERELPAGTALHLFGVHSKGIAEFRDAPWIASYDSMAWQAGSRRSANVEREAIEKKTGRRPRPGDPDWITDDKARKATAMDAFCERQATPGPAQRSLLEVIRASES